LTDARRLVLQLEHERSLRDLDHMRVFMDAAADAWEDVGRQLEILRGAEKDSDEERFKAAGQAADDALHRGQVISRRFSLRLPRGHPAAVAYQQAWSQLSRLVMAARGNEWLEGDFGREVIREAEVGVVKAWQEFHDAAVELVGAQLGSEAAGPERAEDGQDDDFEPPPESTEDGAA
jgi:hypothetical protein